MELLHRFAQDVQPQELPSRFNNPFYYSPHRLCVIAAGAVRDILSCNEALSAEVAKGKMFGVLIVQCSDGSVGYLAAFSGLLAGSNMLDGFVPPVYDLLSPSGYFKQEEESISLLNGKIRERENDSCYVAAVETVAYLRKAMEEELSAMRASMRESKARRTALRSSGALASEEEALLVRESQFQKAELKRATAKWQLKISGAEEAVASFRADIARLKEERKMRSAALQEWLFAQFKVRNARGEEKNLLEIFSTATGNLPPAGSGECAAPKLLQYAYLHGCKPLAMAEFWVGDSPAGEVRRDGCFYGSCKSKCEPILSYMLQGLDVEENALERSGEIDTIAVVYEDDYIIAVDKPSGVLSVPGIVGGTSVQQWLRESYLRSNELYVVHRLDMATSGLLVAAKSVEVYKAMQHMFASREVSKKYIALLDGIPANGEGMIEVPLAEDYINRPRQKVDFAVGKKAVTRFKVLKTIFKNGKECALVQFEPITGRTHQIRVHAACREGLDTPIVGDALYGNIAGRLMLHASSLAFCHPVTGEEISLETKVPF